MTLGPKKRKQQLNYLHQILLTIYEQRSKTALSFWIMLSGWIKQSRLDLPPLVIVLQRYLRELQAIEAEQPISASITEFRKQCRPLVKEQAQRARVGLPASHIAQLFDEIQALLRSWGPDYYEDSRKTLERAIALRADPWSKVEQKRQLNELMRLIYRQQQTRKDHEPLSLWSDVTNHLRQNGLNLEADEIILLCYFQAYDDIENEEQFQVKELSYKDIRVWLFNSKGNRCSVAALRKRVSRAICRLEKAYFLFIH